MKKKFASAALDITAATKGLLIQRMATALINAIISPANGLLVYDSTINKSMANIATPATPNLYPVASGSNNNAWNLNGNNGINASDQFVVCRADRCRARHHLKWTSKQIQSIFISHFALPKIN